MKKIKRITLALIIFSVFSVICFITSLSAQTPNVDNPSMAGQPAPGYLNNQAGTTDPSMAGQPAPGYLNNQAGTTDPSMAGQPAPAPGMSVAVITGNDTIACGEYNNDWRGEIRCLRTLLDTTPMAAKKGSDGLGAYGCRNKDDRQQQIHCLRNILDGNGLAPGTQQ